LPLSARQHLARRGSELSDGERLVALGDNCVDHYRALGVRAAGGNAVNVAVNWARAGLRSAYMGAVGPDPDGELLRAELAAQGVDVSRLTTLPGSTGVTLIELTDDGERLLAHEEFGVTADYRPSAADLDHAAAAAIAHCSTLSDFDHAVGGLAERGGRVSYDFSTRHRVERLDGLEVAFYSWEATADDGARALLRRALAAGARHAVVTCGRHGSLAGDAHELVFVPAQEVDVVDTLGAGDSYIAAFLTALLLERRPLVECAARATEAAADCCQRFGGFPQAATEAVSREAAARAAVVATKQRRNGDGDH
jgi:fructoselysine 6-kinase